MEICKNKHTHTHHSVHFQWNTNLQFLFTQQTRTTSHSRSVEKAAGNKQRRINALISTYENCWVGIVRSKFSLCAIFYPSISLTYSKIRSLNWKHICENIIQCLFTNNIEETTIMCREKGVICCLPIWFIIGDMYAKSFLLHINIKRESHVQVWIV